MSQLTSTDVVGKMQPVNPILTDRVAVIKIKDESFALEAVGNYIIVQEDAFKTGYECKTCEGRRHTDKQCLNCVSDGVSIGTEVLNGILVKCRACEGLCFEKCSDCNGKGGLLIAPENTERRPTRGKVLSCGPDVNRIAAGDHVLYSNHSGHVYEFGIGGSKVAIRYLREIELLCKFHKIEGSIEHKPFKDLEEVGITE